MPAIRMPLNNLNFIDAFKSKMTVSKRIWSVSSDKTLKSPRTGYKFISAT